MGWERKDQYVRYLRQFFPNSGSRSDRLVHKLLYAALIEAKVVKYLIYYLNHYQISFFRSFIEN